jgi:uncharacterized protein (DUF362 family)
MPDESQPIIVPSTAHTIDNCEQALTRREALLQILRVGGVAAAAAGAGFWLYGRSKRPIAAAAEQSRKDHRISATSERPALVIAQYPADGRDAQPGEPRALVQRVLEDLGGISRFVRPQDVVVIKPNIAWDRTPEQAANTNPEIVAEVVRQCRDAGAKRVIVTDVSCNEARRCFHRSGIEAAAKSAGAEVILPDPDLFRDVDLGGVTLKSWPIFAPFLEADKILNLPIAKHHGLCGVTLGMKNWYGILGGQRSRLHQQIHQSLADLAGFMLPTLTIMDCYRILLRNGPTGGNLEDVALKKTVIAGTDPVALDAYVSKAYWDLDPEHLPYLQLASNRGLGTLEFEKLHVKVSRIGQSHG